LAWARASAQGKRPASPPSDSLGLIDATFKRVFHIPFIAGQRLDAFRDCLAGSGIDTDEDLNITVRLLPRPDFDVASVLDLLGIAFIGSSLFYPVFKGFASNKHDLSPVLDALVTETSLRLE
jgi:hypothetical protein